ncbi:hypothetical protein [Streptomyces virginiae]|uniref:hypothetical protein n=1 Tax=Streptomyces virginiae TaxID=1961 RepID=UPI0033329FBE
MDSIAVGSLGLGILKKGSEFSIQQARQRLRTLQGRFPAYVASGGTDYINRSRDYDTVNPSESAPRGLIGSANKTIQLSQQDLNGACALSPRHDARLYEILAKKLDENVNIRIAVSPPPQGLGPGLAYSNMKALSEISDLLIGELATRRLSGTSRNDKAAQGAAVAAAKVVLRRNVQLAAFRSSEKPKWGNGEPYLLHSKVIVVDDSAFYIGSDNLYPSWPQEYGYIRR